MTLSPVRVSRLPVGSSANSNGGAVANALMSAFDIDVTSLPLSSEEISRLIRERNHDQ